MMIKPDPAATADSPVATECGNSQVKESFLLHHARHRGVIHRLCTTYVLRLHPQSFCPTCFQVYSSPPSNDVVLTCVKCYSLCHTHCIATDHTAPPSPYICPLCDNPRTPAFKLKTAKEAYAKTGDGLSVKNEECKVMDRDAAKKLLAAATIDCVSMNKAAVAAKTEAERRAKEAAFTRKRAKEALEHVANLLMKEKLRKNEAAGSGLIEVGGNVAGGFNGAKLKRENNIDVSSSRNGVGASTVVEEKINGIGNADKVNNSNQELTALNAAELRENALSGITSHGVTLNDDQALMDVDGKGQMMVNSGDNAGGFSVERNNGNDIGHVM